MLEEWTMEDLKRLAAIYIRRGTLGKAAALKTELLRRLQNEKYAADAEQISSLLDELTERKVSISSKIAPIFTLFKKSA
ncbi:MAG TPA: hypothetical protein V6C76_07185 [Drouetiella sp.]